MGLVMTSWVYEDRETEKRERERERETETETETETKTVYFVSLFLSQKRTFLSIFSNQNGMFCFGMRAFCRS